jgi:hypothetical protein
MQKELEKKISGRQVFLTLGLWIFLSFLIGAVTYFTLRSWFPDWATVDHQSVTIVAEVYSLFLLSAGIIFKGLKGLSIRLSFKFTSFKDIKLTLKWYGIGLVGSVIVYTLLSPITGSLPTTLLQILHKASDQSRLSNASFLIWFLIIIRACVLAPITEELIFRGLLFGWLRPRFKAISTIILTATLFTIIHSYPILFPLAFIFGIIAGWIRERTGSSLNFVIAHIFNNVIFLTAAYFLNMRGIR